MSSHPRLVDLSHPIVSGMPVQPGLPSPRVEAHISHAASSASYGGLAMFEISRVFLVGNTATSVDSPYHRFPGAPDLASLPLEALVRLPTLVVDAPGGARPCLEGDPPVEGAGHAVLLRTGWDRRWGTAAYWEPAPCLAAGFAERLVASGVALVGTDAWNVDDPGDARRPVHTLLLGAGIPIVEHLACLDALPARGARFTAVPAPIRGGASFPVRAFAELPHAEDGRI